MSFNTRILSIVLSNVRFGSDIESMLKRYQSLSIIYINLSLFGIICGYELTSWLKQTHSESGLLTVVFLPITFLSLILLRRENYEASATLVVISMQLSNFYDAHIQGNHLATLFGLMIAPNFCFFISSSWKIKILNMFLTMCQFLHHTYYIQKIFMTTFDEEQSRQISTLHSAVLTCLISLCVITSIQKSIEMNLWKMAQSSYEKSENLTKEVLQASEAKDVFVSSLSHEIRNPLNALNGTIDYLLEAVNDANHLKMLNNAKLSAEILLHLANNVLDAAKLKSDKMDISYTEGSFEEVVRKALVINSETIKAKKISVNTVIDKNLPGTIQIDPSRLLQIMMNLMSNALKFTPEEGRISIRVTWCTDEENKDNLLLTSADIKKNRMSSLYSQQSSLNNNEWRSGTDTNLFLQNVDYDELNLEDSLRLEQNMSSLKQSKTFVFRNKNNFNQSSLLSDPWTISHKSFSMRLSQHELKNGYIKVEVSDSGCGIPEGSIPKLFEMFAQAHQSVTNMQGGTGLGLWISKQLCQKMGGDIKLYSTENVGTTFVFYVSVKNDITNLPQPPNLNQRREHINILVADDYAHNRDLHKLILQKEGATVVTASNGREAFEKYKDKEAGYFDFLMMDVKMPEIDGFQAALMIRKWEKEHNRKKTDIYFVSGEYFDEEEVIANFRHIVGADEASGTRCLKKPIDVNVIKTITNAYRNQNLEDNEAVL